MKKLTVVITGTSSFTGAAFAKSLAESGHEVIAPLRQARSAYKGLESKRLASIERHCKLIPGAPFGFDSFLNLIMQIDKIDVLCHHASRVTGYKNNSFDLIQAVENNTLNLNSVLDCLERKKCKHICLTGSLLEPNEGAGSCPDHAFNLYGLSKNLTTQVFKHYTQEREMVLGKFVLPNPFGPWERKNLTTEMALEWLDYKAGVVHNPRYVRDYVPVSLLALSYSRFVQSLADYTHPCFTKLNPSFYAESQESFITRFAHEMETRLGVHCQFGVKEDPSLLEPSVRINTDQLDPLKLGWNEGEAWDELAAYYKQLSRISQD